MFFVDELVFAPARQNPHATRTRRLRALMDTLQQLMDVPKRKGCDIYRDAAFI